MNDILFHHKSGEPVQVGDRVIVSDLYYGVIESIDLPGGATAEALDSPTGGIMIAENFWGLVTYLFTTPNSVEGDSNWDETVFLHRGPVILPAYGVGTWPWPYEPGPFGGEIGRHADSFKRYSEFEANEFGGSITVRGLLESLKADGITVPEATNEIESLNKLLRGNVLTRIGAHVFLPESNDLMRFLSSLSERERVRLNRLNLEAAYPLKCPKKP